MTDIAIFIQNHGVLSLSWIVIVLLIVLYELHIALTAAKALTPQQAVNLMNQQGAIVIDLRTSVEFNQGFIVNSVNIPVETLSNNSKQLQSYQDKMVILVCSNGMASKKQASELLKRHILKNVHILARGISSWKEAGLPLNVSKSKER